MDGLSAHLLEPGTDVVKFVMTIPSGYERFKGHFPEFPLVAGVCQLAWVQSAIRQWFDPAFILSNIDSAKFSAFIVPETEVLVEISKNGVRSYKFSIASADGLKKFASGRIPQ